MKFDKIILLGAAILAASSLPLEAKSRKGKGDVTVAVFSLNDFHGGFVRNDYKNIPGAPAVWQTLDSLKSVYPYNVTVAAGDNFGGSFFYAATKGVLLPVFYNDLGIHLSALGNHEFDDGQKALAQKWQGAPLRPAGWNLSYVCANVRNASGEIPAFAQPFASAEIPIGKGKSVKVGFVGLLASSTPSQTSKSKIAGLTFDGRYTAVLDSVKRLPGYSSTVGNADLRLLLTHIGSRMSDGQPEWDDKDAANLRLLDDPTWNGILSSHSHQPVCGTINACHYPIVQGKWHGEYISVLKATINLKKRKVKKVEVELCPVNPNAALGAPQRRLQSQIDSLLTHTKTQGGAPLGMQLATAPQTLEHDRDHKHQQTVVGAIVCRAYAEAYRSSASLPDSAIIIGASHFGSIRAGFTKGPVSVLDVGEVLPFSNPLCAFRMTGRQLRELVEFGLHNQRYGWLQTGWLDVMLNQGRHVQSLSYYGPDGAHRYIADDTPVVLVADEFIVNGGDGYDPSFFPSSQKITSVQMPATTDAFVHYLQKIKTLPLK